MRRQRNIVEGAAYHVTSRTNAQANIFIDNLSQKIMLMVIEEAKEKFGFKLHNFCVMPNHIHLLITPTGGTNLSRIIQWIKTRAAKRWNFINKSGDHLWGERFFSRPVKNVEEFNIVYNYIDQNPVKAGLVQNAWEWKASGAFHIKNNLDLIDQ